MYKQLRTEICRVMQLASSKGWSPGSSANISVRVPGKNHVCIKSTGTNMAFALLDPMSSVVVTDLDGNPVDGTQKPSVELRFHLGIYQVRPDVGSVFHAHPRYATSYAIADRELPLVTGPGRFVLKNVPLLAFAPSGSPELADIVTAAFSDRTVLSALLGGHGVVAVGADMYEAFNHLDWTEDAAQIAFLSSYLRDKSSRQPVPG